MGEIEKIIITTLKKRPGLSDKELAEAIRGRGKPSQYINQKCRVLAAQGILDRKARADGRLGNWLTDDSYYLKARNEQRTAAHTADIAEKRIKQVLESYLTAQKWEPRISWSSGHGIDIDASRGDDRWIIEVKGAEDCNPAWVNLFLTVLGELLQRMDNPQCKYSIALPDIDHLRRLWERLPPLAKRRTGISALFVNPQGDITEITG